MGMNRKQAVKELSQTGKLTTAMLKPLGISFESFLRFAQMNDKACEGVIKKLIYHLSQEK